MRLLEFSILTRFSDQINYSGNNWDYCHILTTRTVHIQGTASLRPSWFWLGLTGAASDVWSGGSLAQLRQTRQEQSQPQQQPDHRAKSQQEDTTAVNIHQNSSMSKKESRPTVRKLPDGSRKYSRIVPFSHTELLLSYMQLHFFSANTSKTNTS